MDHQHRGLRRQWRDTIALDGFFELIDTDLFIFEELIGRFGVIPALIVPGNTGTRLRGDLVDKGYQPLLAAYIPKVRIGELLYTYRLHRAISFLLKVHPILHRSKIWVRHSYLLLDNSSVTLYLLHS